MSTSSHPSAGIEQYSAHETPIRFGTFTLFAQQHVLLSEGKPVLIGSRALDLLICMAKRPGELLEKYELIAMAWPRTVVAECNLRAQIVALRRVLKEREPHNEYVTTIPGRGYRFIAHPAASPVVAPNTTIVPRPLPAIEHVIGREELIGRLSDQLRTSRFMTLTGAGGVGKTTVAVEVARRLEGEFPDGVLLFELFDYLRLEGILATLTESLGLQTSEGMSLEQVFGQLGECRCLLVIDNCEQAVGAVAKLAEALLRWAPNCAILATSREALQADGEMVERIEPLALPDEQPVLPYSNILSCPSVHLFLDRIRQHDAHFRLEDAQIEAIVAICMKLNGMPLDIEVAAESAATLPLDTLSDLLDGEFRLQMRSQRDCERQRSLRASLDWSYDALSIQEQAVLCMMSVFRGSFTLNAVLALVEDDQEVSPADVLTSLDRLVDKSLLVAHRGGSGRNYRMLETTRLYGMEKLQQSGRFERLAARHAAYALSVLQDFATQLEASAPEAWKDLYGAESETVKAALSWACSADGNQSLGLDLTLTALGLSPQDSEAEAS